MAVTRKKVASLVEKKVAVVARITSANPKNAVKSPSVVNKMWLRGAVVRNYPLPVSCMFIDSPLLLPLEIETQLNNK